MCEPALCTLLTGSSRSPVMMETYYLVRCSAVSHRDKGKWRQVLWSAVYVRGIGFACRIFSITFPFSSPLLSLFLPVVLYPLASSQRAARCHPWISLPLIHQILWHKIKPKKIDQIWPQRVRQRAAAAAGMESGFYRHKSLLWWGILSNGNFFLTGGVIASPLWTPLDIYTPSCTSAFLWDSGMYTDN